MKAEMIEEMIVGWLPHRWCTGGMGPARRAGTGGLAARLMYACRDRRSAMRRRVPLTERARGCGHS